MKKSALLFISLCAFSAQAQEVKSYANEFLNIGVDAAAMGMANSVVAHSGNANSTYWNPAGLSHVVDKEVGLMHASYFANIAQYDFASFAMRLSEDNVIGFSITRFGVDDILNTTELIDQNGVVDYNRISKFSTSDYAFNVSFSHVTIVDGLSIGGNVKVLRRIIGDFADAWGYGLDFGAQYKTESNWKFGAMIRDVTATESVWKFNQSEIDKIKDAIDGQNQTLPEKNERSLPRLQLGVAKDFSINDKFNVLAAMQLNTDFYQTNALISTEGFSLQPSIGFQVGYIDMIFVRGGLGNFQNELQIDGNEKLSFQPNIGLGFKYKGISVDYALTDIGNQSAAIYSNIFSLRLDLNVFKK